MPFDDTRHHTHLFPLITRCCFRSDDHTNRTPCPLPSCEVLHHLGVRDWSRLICAGLLPIYRTLASAHPSNARATSTRETRCVFSLSLSPPRCISVLLSSASALSRLFTRRAPAWPSLLFVPKHRLRVHVCGVVDYRDWEARRWRRGEEEDGRPGAGIGSSHGDWCDLFQQKIPPIPPYLLAHFSFPPLVPSTPLLFPSNPPFIRRLEAPQDVSRCSLASLGCMFKLRWAPCLIIIDPAGSSFCRFSSQR